MVCNYQTMAKFKRQAWQKWIIGFIALSFFSAIAIHRVLHPPLPSYFKPPPGSSVEMSRQFYGILQNPQYFCRVYSPLSLNQTMTYMKKSCEDAPFAMKDKTMNGCGLKRQARFVDTGYLPKNAHIGGEVSSVMRFWHEFTGTTIEFYVESGF